MQGEKNKRYRLSIPVLIYFLIIQWQSKMFIIIFNVHSQKAWWGTQANNSHLCRSWKQVPEQKSQESSPPASCPSQRMETTDVVILF